MNATKPQTPLIHIQQFKCSNCGGELRVINPRTNFIACQYCGTVQEARTEAHKMLLQLSRPSEFPPMGFIRLGMEAVFNGLKHRVIGRTRWHSTFQEWDGESQQYEPSTWQFDEWLLLNEHYAYFYLVEDKEGFALSYPHIPQHPNLPTSSGWIKDFQTGERRRVLELGEAQVVYFEGESTYQIEIDKKINFAEYKVGSTVFVVESHFYKGTQELQEIEFWREVPITYQQVLQAFAQNPAIQAMVKAHLARRNINRTIVRGFRWLAIACLLAFIASFSYTSVLDVTYAVPFVIGKGYDAQDSVQLIGQSERFVLDKPGEMIEFTISVVANGFRDGWVGLEICNANDEVVNTLEGNFYQESEESSTAAYDIYKVDKPGEYYVKIYVEPQSWLSENESSVRVEVSRVWMLGRYYIIGFFLFIMMATILSVILPQK
ncbi:MAG: TFIIB-type zinc ribbon-containing protein [Cytophagales bacterium]|nr:TFIIB-type zinc ribbon-containing protein [Bernardetiaceae bacterium]MDW8205723.1 TFIIB-type zinc ribbon-containing protein [Cytophagales bacterium]